MKLNDQQCTGMESFSTSCTDSSEYESIKDHAGWALKRTRDVLVKDPNQIPLKVTDEPTSTILYADKPSAIEIISLLGTDIKQLNSNFRFIIHDHAILFRVSPRLSGRIEQKQGVERKMACFGFKFQLKN